MNGVEITKRIDKLLQDKNIKRSALAEIVGISTNTISAWKSRGSMLPADTALKIAEYLGVSVEWLITGETKNNDLSPEDSMHLSNYNALDESDKMVVDKLIESLLVRYTTGGQTDGLEKRLG